MSPLLFLVMVCAYGAGALAALVMPRGAAGRGLVALCAASGAAAGLLLGANIILTGVPFTLMIPELLPLGGGLALRLDPLGAFFLVLIGVGAIPAAIFGAGYTADYDDGRASLRLLGVMLNLFLLAMSLVTLADNVLTFLLMWEAMSLTSYFLVITEPGEEGTLSAGLWYAAMTHAGLSLLLAGFVLLAGGGSGAFADLRAGATHLSPTVRDIVFILVLLGFGSKAGVVPLHVWLPRAHPAAPSHVSALMSGVMLKLGIYGLLRVVLDLLGGGPAWWGGSVLILGAASALLGILYALMENDLKRLLAYSSVENVGIILMAIGTGLLFRAYGLPALAMLAFIGGLYHSLNHAAFKGLLFLGAGAVLHAAHTRNMEALGGLIGRMPWTAFFFLVGSVAIAALPPLNGFAGEWLVFQAMLGSASIPVPEVAIAMSLAVAALALTSGLAAACFVKAFGITFLAIPRSPAAEHVREAPRSMRAGMALLALVCVVLGLAPSVVVPLLGGVLAGLGGLPATQPTFVLGITLQTPAGLAQMSPPLVALSLLLVLGLLPVAMRLLRVSRRLRLSDSWGCGRVGQTPRMEYTATAFAEPLRRVFAELYRPTKDLTIDFHPESKYFVQSIAFRTEIRSWFDEFLYEPLLALALRLSEWARRIQSGSLHDYLAYMFVALLLFLVWLLLTHPSP